MIEIKTKNKQTKKMKQLILSLGVVLALSSCGGNTTESTTTTDTTSVSAVVDSMAVDTTAVVDTATVDTTKVGGN